MGAAGGASRRRTYGSAAPLGPSRPVPRTLDPADLRRPRPSTSLARVASGAAQRDISLLRATAPWPRPSTRTTPRQGPAPGFLAPLHRRGPRHRRAAVHRPPRLAAPRRADARSLLRRRAASRRPTSPAVPGPARLSECRGQGDAGDVAAPERVLQPSPVCPPTVTAPDPRLDARSTRHRSRARRRNARRAGHGSAPRA